MGVKNMIDEKKLIEDIKECYTEEFLAEYGFDKLVEAQPKVGEWIPCSDYLHNALRFIEQGNADVAYDEICYAIIKSGGKLTESEEEYRKKVC